MNHGTRTTYTHHGCRCELCRMANADYCLQADERRKANLATSGVEHGKVSTYRNHGCRCEPCAAAHSVQLREEKTRRAQRPPLDPDDHRHGTDTAYTYHRCRCQTCVTAATRRRSLNRILRKNR